MIVCGHYPVYLCVACVCCQLVVLLTGIFSLVSDFLVSFSSFTSVDSKRNTCRDLSSVFLNFKSLIYTVDQTLVVIHF